MNEFEIPEIKFFSLENLDVLSSSGRDNEFPIA